MAPCPEVDVASQGDTVDQARANLREALELFFETASDAEIAERFHGEVYVTQVEVLLGRVKPLSGTDICALLRAHGFLEFRRRGSHIVMQKRVPVDKELWVG